MQKKATCETGHYWNLVRSDLGLTFTVKLECFLQFCTGHTAVPVPISVLVPEPVPVPVPIHVIATVPVPVHLPLSVPATVPVPVHVPVPVPVYDPGWNSS